MKGYNNDYFGGVSYNPKPVNGVDYNTAGSSSVGQVDSVEIIIGAHEMSTTGTPNSVGRNYKNGKLNSERYYGPDGKGYLDLDYTNHGNSKTHPIVPHEHDIWFDINGGFHRGKDKGIE